MSFYTLRCLRSSICSYTIQHTDMPARLLPPSSIYSPSSPTLAPAFSAPQFSKSLRRQKAISAATNNLLMSYLSLPVSSKVLYLLYTPMPVPFMAQAYFSDSILSFPFSSCIHIKGFSLDSIYQTTIKYNTFYTHCRFFFNALIVNPLSQCIFPVRTISIFYYTIALHYRSCHIQ